MKKTILFLMLAVSGMLWAQTPKSILDQASATLAGFDGVSMAFSLNNTNKKASSANFSQKGTVWIKGNKFKISTQDGVTWFNGKTQWTYVKSTSEVNVTNPDNDELATVSPVAVLGLYKTGFKLANKGEATIGGKKVVRVEMTAKAKNAPVARYLVSVDKRTYHVVQVELSYINGNQMVISIPKYTAENNLSDNLFVFNPKEYPKAEVVDLR